MTSSSGRRGGRSLAVGVLTTVLALIGWLVGGRPVSAPAQGPVPSVERSSPRVDPALPPEALATLKAIDEGGPFPFERDGVVFENREGLLPRKPRGYYHEYTVPTPGEHSRGARRIIAGGEGERFYSGDHYEHFTPVSR